MGYYMVNQTNAQKSQIKITKVAKIKNKFEGKKSLVFSQTLMKIC